LKKIVWLLIRSFVVFIYFAVKVIPLKTALALGGFLGDAVFFLLPGQREKSIENLRRAFKDKPGSEVYGIARMAFENLGRNFFELLCFRRTGGRKRESYVEVHGREILEENFRKGRGLIILMSHFGNWELQAGTIGKMGYPVSAIARRVIDPVLNGMLVSFRRKSGFRTILRGESPKEVLRVLKRREILVILLDQFSARLPGVHVDFFGRKCYASSGLASIVRKLEVPVLPSYIVRKKYGHELWIKKPVSIKKGGGRDDDLFENTQKFTKEIEGWVREYPSQWVWMHDRWRGGGN